MLKRKATGEVIGGYGGASIEGKRPSEPEHAKRVEQDRRLRGVEPSTGRDLRTKILQVLATYGARSPHFIARALGVNETLVLADLKNFRRTERYVCGPRI